MFLVQVNKGNILHELILVTTDRDKAQAQFLDTCASAISNWADYTQADKDALLDLGYEQTGDGAVVLIDTDGVTSNNAIAAALLKQPPKTVDRITTWLRTGEIGEAPTITELLERAGRLLDKCESHEICGEVIFVAEDGNTYVVTTEVVVGEIHPEYLKEVLEENAFIPIPAPLI